MSRWQLCSRTCTQAAIELIGQPRPLFVPNGGHRVEPCSTSRRQRTGEPRNQCKRNCCSEQEQGIARTLRIPTCQHFVQGECKKAAGDDTPANARDHGAKDNAEHMPSLRAQGYSNPKFIGALDNRVRDDAIEPHRSQGERQSGKCSEEPGDKLAPAPTPACA
jgi:hypothetical protein